MEQTKTNFFQRLFYSITDFTFYQDVVKETIGKAIGYLFLFSLLISLLASIKPTIDFTNGLNGFSQVFQAEVPDFSFRNGELSIETDEPIIFNEGGQIIIIDTSGQYDESILNQYESGVVVTKNYAVNKENAVKTERIDFGELRELSFTKSQVAGFIPYFKYFSIAIVLWFIISTIIGKLIGALVVSLLGLIINAVMKTTLIYSEIFRAGVYAMTLPSLLKVLVSLLPISIPFFFVAYYVIVGVYLAKAFSLIEFERKHLTYNKPQDPRY